MVPAARLGDVEWKPGRRARECDGLTRCAVFYIPDDGYFQRPDLLNVDKGKFVNWRLPVWVYSGAKKCNGLGDALNLAYPFRAITNGYLD